MRPWGIWQPFVRHVIKTTLTAAGWTKQYRTYLPILPSEKIANDFCLLAKKKLNALSKWSLKKTTQLNVIFLFDTSIPIHNISQRALILLAYCFLFASKVWGESISFFLLLSSSSFRKTFHENQKSSVFLSQVGSHEFP